MVTRYRTGGFGSMVEDDEGPWVKWDDVVALLGGASAPESTEATALPSVTPNEIAVLNHIARNSYAPTNYGVPKSFADTGAVWSHSILDSSAPEKVSPRSLPGICSSLVKKGLAVARDEGKDASIEMTESGFAVWLAHYA